MHIKSGDHLLNSCQRLEDKKKAFKTINPINFIHFSQIKALIISKIIIIIDYK